MANEYRVTSVSFETLHGGAAAARVSSLSAEVMHIGAAAARVSSVFIEVFRSIEDAPAMSRRRAAVIIN